LGFSGNYGAHQASTMSSNNPKMINQCIAGSRKHVTFPVPQKLQVIKGLGRKRRKNYECL
jgi:hypothetical protein